MPIGHNRVLGNPDQRPQDRAHRVALADWPASVKDPRVATLEALLGFLKRHGYEGTEFGVGSFRRYFDDESEIVVARRARRALADAGLANFGTTLHAGDAAMRKLNWLDDYRRQMEVAAELGGEFVSFQVYLADDYLHTGGLYREDETYLRWCADRVSELRSAAWEQGLNFYLEVHVDRITEDPAACCRLLELATCELTGDLSHLQIRGMLRGAHVEKILAHTGHTHVRMARRYGDLSAGVDDPAADWADRGVTWQMFQLMTGALAGGLSSRTLSGETGPIHLVSDPLTQDAKLVPLYRAMARYADASAQGIGMNVDDPEDLRPWG
ncbi:MAG: TIM barrel protein [Phycisphaeraceae bacterium]|nr:TIM barrel protein [Phycisphaeraceae bacterium]